MVCPRDGAVMAARIPGLERCAMPRPTGEEDVVDVFSELVTAPSSALCMVCAFDHPCFWHVQVRVGMNLGRRRPLACGAKG